MADEHTEDNIDVETIASGEEPQYGVGPFSIREVALAGTWLVAFVVSFFPVYGSIGVGPSVWSNGIDWLLAIGVPTVAVFLIVLRRLSPQGIRRVGSLGIDQFASVAFSVSTVLWLTTIWNSFITLANQRMFLATWVAWVEFFLMLAGVVLTVFAPFIAPFAQDFRGRPETIAHRNARPVRPITPRPLIPRDEPARAGDPYAAPADATAGEPEGSAPVADEPVRREDAPTAVFSRDDVRESAPTADDSLGADDGFVEEPVYSVSAPESDRNDTEAFEPTRVRETFAQNEAAAQNGAAAQSEGAAQPAAARQQAFWALVPEERDVVDEIGIPVFRVGPTAWALVIEDRGDTFVVRHEDGRIGYLHDVSGVTRG